MSAPLKTKVIYITGWGHSGSTLLSMLIGMSQQVVSVGEFVFFDVYREKEQYHKVWSDFRCSCGEYYRDCPFWHEVACRANASVPAVIHDKSNLMRMMWIWRLFCHVLFRGRGVAPTHFTGYDHQILNEVLQTSGGQVVYVCDSSKDFARLARLLTMPDIEVSAIHLIRDGRAVAYSYSKGWRQELGVGKCSYTRALILWIGINLLNRIILRIARCRPIHISYDLFCKDVPRYIRFLNTQYDLEIPETDYMQEVNQQNFHHIGGNPFQSKRLQEIRYDDEWKHRLPWWKLWIGIVVVGPFLPFWVKRDSVSRTNVLG